MLVVIFCYKLFLDVDVMNCNVLSAARRKTKKSTNPIYKYFCRLASSLKFASKEIPTFSGTTDFSDSEFVFVKFWEVLKNHLADNLI